MKHGNRTYPSSQHRIVMLAGYGHSGSTVGTLIAESQMGIGKSDDELAKDLGFSRGIIVADIKAGTLKLPLGKMPALSSALEIDPSDVLSVLLQDYYSTELLELMGKVWAVLDLTADEKKLVAAYRRLIDNHEGQPKFVEADAVITVSIS